MYKQSPSGRSHRSRGFKVKHVLQICVLLAVCFWLIYQVKQSHEKKNESDGKEPNLSQKTGISDEVPKLGRKDLLPHSKEIPNDNEKHEVVDNDDDLDENSEKKIDDGVEREDEVVDDEKENEDKNVKGQDGNSEDNENDEDSGSRHEAQEQLYKADDASSAVTHENENGGLEEVRENAEVNDLKQAGDEVNSDKEIIDGRNTTLAQDRETADESVEERNLTEKRRETNSLSIPNGVQSSNLDSTQYHNVTLSGKNEDTESALSDSSTESNHTKSSVSEKIIHGHPRFTTQDDRWSSTIADDYEKSGMVDQTDGSDAALESFGTENIGEMQDMSDDSDSSLPLEEKDVRTDLETLPEIQTEGSNTEDLAAK